MKKNIPKKLLEEYEVRRNEFKNSLDRIVSLLKLRLGQLASHTGTRGRITDARVKRPAKVWENASKSGLTVDEAFTGVEDLLGIRIVCNNLSDISPIIEMIRRDCSILSVIEVKDLITSPSNKGYKATHVRTKFIDIFGQDKKMIPCEIQIRTLAQDTWARLSRADLYGKSVPSSIHTLSNALSTQLSAIDEIAQLIRDELNRCPPTAKEIKDTDTITPQRLALLFRHKFGEDIYEMTLIDWVKHLEEAEAKTIGDTRELLDDTRIKYKINKIAKQIRGYDLEVAEWAVYSAMAASEVSIKQGIKSVQTSIKKEWDEIVAITKNEALSEMPETLEKFIEMLKEGVAPIGALKELGAIQSCYRCGTEVLRSEQAADAVQDYYEKEDLNLDLESLFEHSNWADIPEVESIDFSGACQYCGYQMAKDH